MKRQRGELGIHDQRQYEGSQKLQTALDKADGSGNENKGLFVLGIDTKAEHAAVAVQEGLALRVGSRSRLWRA